MVKERQPAQIGSVIAQVLSQSIASPRACDAVEVPTGVSSEGHVGAGRFDFDLADFPVFRFSKGCGKAGSREPLVYADTIRGAGGQPVTRTWKAYPGPFGFGGESTQATLFDLFQLYAEQGARGGQIQFGTIRSLFQRRSDRNPSKRDYERIRRDIDILRGYDFHCTNAFWDARRRAYVDMNWRLFGSVFYFKAPPGDGDELPFGFIEVSPILREIARTRGFFCIGFPARQFHDLRPLEQRLAVYLAKKFMSQGLHRRFVEDLADALPVEAACERDVRKAVRSAAQGLIDKGVPTLAGFRFERSNDGRWVVVFDRKEAPKQDYATVRAAAAAMEPYLEEVVERVMVAVGSRDDRLWWERCVRRLGVGPVERGLGLLKEASQSGKVRSKGAVLTKFLKDIAIEMRVAIR
ncbi:MAG: hypothetical protein U0746_03125 [Gemmataceae bacterium]